MTNGFLNDLPDLDMPGKKRKKKSPGPGAPGPGIPGPKEQVVRYVKPRCPKCGSDKVPVYDSSHLPIRYHKCSDCGNTFKSIEENYQEKSKNTENQE